MMADNFFQIKRKLFYKFKSNSPFSIHSQRVYDYYTQTFLPNRKATADTLITASISRWKDEFKGSRITTVDLSNNVIPNKLPIPFDGKDIIIFKGINTSKETLNYWHQTKEKLGTGLCLESYHFGAIFLIDTFAKQQYILK